MPVKDEWEDFVKFDDIVVVDFSMFSVSLLRWDTFEVWEVFVEDSVELFSSVFFGDATADEPGIFFVEFFIDCSSFCFIEEEVSEES